MIVFLNGEFVPEEKAVISVFDRGFLYGDTVYETVRAHRGRILFWEEHDRRLRRSFVLAAFEPDPRIDALASVFDRLLERNGLSEARLRITVSRGSGGVDQLVGFEHTWVVTARPFEPLPEARYEEGIEVVLVGVSRNDRGALDPEIKSGNFLNNLLARREARLRGADEGIMLSPSGLLAEGSISNLFWVAEGVLETPALDVGLLPGVTRGKILDLARALPELQGVREVRAGAERLREAQEIFLTSTSLEVLPVTRFEGRPVGDARRGPVARLLRERLCALYPV